MLCQSCGVDAPTKHVEFHQNIGALVVRFSKSIKGELCKNCINKYFWRFTLIDLLLGWWGVISLIMTPIFIINNIIRYIGSLGLEPVPSTAMVPNMTEQVIERLKPHTDEIFTRINGGEPFESVMRNIAQQAGVLPGEVMLFTRAVISASKKQPKK